MELLENFFIRSDNIAWRVIDGETFVVNPKDSLVYPLNSVATRIWELLDGSRKVREIIDIIDKEFETDKEIIRKDALDFIEKLIKAELIKNHHGEKNGV